MFKKIRQWLRHRRMWVIADAKDNSVTFSKSLFKHMDLLKQDEAKVFAFYIPDSEEYGFVLNPQLEQETQLAEVKYNTKYKCVGFEMLVPTVNRVMYDYGLPHGAKAKFSVEPREIGELTYYAICRPRR